MLSHGGVSSYFQLLLSFYSGNTVCSNQNTACLAAAKTIINELKQDLPDASPILWTTQAFSVAAAVSLLVTKSAIIA